MQLRPGDRLCLYSDGVIEQTDRRGGEQFGVARLLQSLTTRGDLTAEQGVKAVADDLNAWAGCRKLIDDVSLVVVEWQAPGSSAN